MTTFSRLIVYKLSKSLFPCLLITLSIGFTYAFSLFVPHITELLNVSTISVRFAFCLNIFWLGIGAALFGKLIEHKIKISAILSTTLLFLGLIMSGLGMLLKNIWFLYIGFGFLCGIAEGIGYVTPVLNNILWFGKGKMKGLVASLSIISFGLGSSLCSLLFGYLIPVFTIKYVFFAYAIIYVIMMSVGCILINKPKFVKSKKHKKETFSYKDLFKDKYAQLSWMYMFLNISMGLILIGSCASILKELNISGSLIILIMMTCGVFNGAGRLVFPLLSDYTENRSKMLLNILLIEILVMLPSIFWYDFMVVSIIIINATYGSFFAMLPSVLSDHYGNTNLSIRHSAILSSWGIASVFAFICTYFISAYGNGYYFLAILLPVVYFINYIIVRKINR